MLIKIGNLELTASYGNPTYETTIYIAVKVGAVTMTQAVDRRELLAAIEALEKSCIRPS